MMWLSELGIVTEEDFVWKALALTIFFLLVIEHLKILFNTLGMLILRAEVVPLCGLIA